MRNLHTSTPVGLVSLNQSAEKPINLRGSHSVSLNTKLGFQADESSHRSFSQLSRGSVIQKNVKDACLFMDEQQRVLKQLIKEFQIFIGYREQLPKSQKESINEHSWSVYLMHAQSLQSALKTVYMGKALFGDGAQPPIRFHLLKGDSTEPFDLPDPCLISMIPIRAFLGGISGHHLPSVKLGNACIAELLNALVDVQHGKERLHQFTHTLKTSNKKKSLRISPMESRHSVKNKTLSWGERILLGLNSVLGISQPSNA
jgi:hypothetical protein